MSNRDCITILIYLSATDIPTLLRTMLHEARGTRTEIAKVAAVVTNGTLDGLILVVDDNTHTLDEISTTLGN